MTRSTSDELFKNAEALVKALEKIKLDLSIPPRITPSVIDPIFVNSKNMLVGFASDEMYEIAECFDPKKERSAPDVKKNLLEAEMWYKIAALREHKDALTELSSRAEELHFTPSSVFRVRNADELLKIGNESFDSDLLAMCQSPARPYFWFGGGSYSEDRIATKKILVPITIRLHGTPTSHIEGHKKAVKIYTEQAELEGNHYAMLELALTYDTANPIRVCSVEKNMKEAIKWYRLAAQNGNEYAKEVLTQRAYEFFMLDNSDN